MLKNIQTLHCHTSVSDGSLSPLEVLDVCQEAGIRVVALTDHDAVPDEKAVRALMDKKDHQTKWVMGVEISSGYPKEKGGGPADLLHVVGLFVDPFNKELLGFCKKMQQARIDRILRTIKNLQKLGFDIKENECLKLAGDRVVSRNHVVYFMVNRKSNLEIIDRYWRQMLGESKKIPKILKECQKIKDEGLNQKVFGLFLLERSYVTGVYEGLSYWLDLDNTVALIRNAGGLAFFAHPDPTILSFEAMETILAESRIDGSEVVFSLFERGTSLEGENRDNMRKMSEIVERHGRLASGGVDAHGKGDLKGFVGAEDYSGRTVGMVEKLVEKSGVDIKWSSL